MGTNFIEIDSITGGVENVVMQDLKFRTGKFVWRVKFNSPLNPSTVNNMNLYVTDGSNKPLKTSIRYDTFSNYIEIEPLEAYAQDEPYFLNISKNVESRGGQRLKSDIRLRFKI